MTTVIDIARHLVWLSSKEPELDPVTHMQVQKLVYYAQGWSLAINDTPLFDDRIEAWRHGPVAPRLHQELKSCKNDPIPVGWGDDGRGLSAEAKAVVRRVWDGYKRYSAIGLSELTHRESPWIDAYQPSDPDGRCRREITPSAMRSFFSLRLTRQRIPGLDPARAVQAKEQARQGKLVPMERIPPGAR